MSTFGGMGFALALSLLWLGIVWFNGKQPQPPPKPWDGKAIVAEPTVRFSLAEGKGREIDLRYTLENKSGEDYRIEYDAPLTTLLRDKEGTLSDITGDRILISKPVFIPAGQKAFLNMTLLIPALPERKAFSSAEYIDAVGGFLQSHFRKNDSFVVFDPEAGYEIDLPVPVDETHSDNDCGYHSVLDGDRQGSNGMLHRNLQVI